MIGLHGNPEGYIHSLMKMILKWTLDFFWVPLLAPILSSYLVTNGWHGLPLDIPEKVYEFFIRAFGEEAFPWVAGTSAGVAVGFLLRGASTRFLAWLNGPNSTEEKLQSIGANAGSVITDLTMTLRSVAKRVYLNNTGIPPGLHGKLEHLCGELKKLKVTIPNFDGLPDADLVELAHGYLSFIHPFILAGDIAELRIKASGWVEKRQKP